MPEARSVLLTVQLVFVEAFAREAAWPVFELLINLAQDVLVSSELHLIRGSCRGGAVKGCVWFGVSCCT